MVASVQPYHLRDDGRFLEEYIGKERSKNSFAFRSLIEAGAVLAFGSDWFVAPPSPIQTINAADNRRIGEKVFFEEQKVLVEEAMLACTL